MYYKQCILKKGELTQTAWIPEEFAKQDKYIMIKEADQWEDGWQVIEIGTREHEEYVLARERDYLHNREASDI